MKAKVILSAILLTVSASMSAQFTNSAKKSSVSTTPIEGWKTLYVQYDNIALSPEHGDDQKLHGIALGFGKAWNIMQSHPLMFETGLAMRFAFGSEETFSEKTEYGTLSADAKTNMFSAKVPLNLTYAWALPNSKVVIAPYAGLHMNLHFMAKAKEKVNFEVSKEYAEYEKEFLEILEEEEIFDTESVNLFDKKDMGSKDATWNRFQMGWQIGAKVFFSKYFAGIQYGTDFTETAKKMKAKDLTVTLGCKF